MTKSMKTLLDVQIGTHPSVEGVTDEHDLIKLSLSLMTVHLAKLIPVLAKYSLKVGNRKPDKDVIVRELGVVLEHTFILCNTLNFDIPDDDELSEFEETTPWEVRHDSILTLMGMISASSDLFHIIYVESEVPAWENEAIHGDLAEIVSTIIVGMKHLGEKFNFSPEDVMCQFS